MKWSKIITFKWVYRPKNNWFITWLRTLKLFRIYKHVWHVSSSVNLLFTSCIIFRSALSFGYQTNMTLACLLRFFSMAEEDCVIYLPTVKHLFSGRYRHSSLVSLFLDILNLLYIFIVLITDPLHIKLVVKSIFRFEYVISVGNDVRSL